MENKQTSSPSAVLKDVSNAPPLSGNHSAAVRASLATTTIGTAKRTDWHASPVALDLVEDASWKLSFSNSKPHILDGEWQSPPSGSQPYPIIPQLDIDAATPPWDADVHGPSFFLIPSPCSGIQAFSPYKELNTEYSSASPSGNERLLIHSPKGAFSPLSAVDSWQEDDMTFLDSLLDIEELASPEAPERNRKLTASISAPCENTGTPYVAWNSIPVDSVAIGGLGTSAGQGPGPLSTIQTSPAESAKIAAAVAATAATTASSEQTQAVTSAPVESVSSRSSIGPKTVRARCAVYYDLVNPDTDYRFSRGATGKKNAAQKPLRFSHGATGKENTAQKPLRRSNRFKSMQTADLVLVPAGGSIPSRLPVESAVFDVEICIRPASLTDSVTHY